MANCKLLTAELAKDNINEMIQQLDCVMSANAISQNGGGGLVLQNLTNMLKYFSFKLANNKVVPVRSRNSKQTTIQRPTIQRTMIQQPTVQQTTVQQTTVQQITVQLSNLQEPLIETKITDLPIDAILQITSNLKLPEIIHFLAASKTLNDVKINIDTTLPNVDKIKMFIKEALPIIILNNYYGTITFDINKKQQKLEVIYNISNNIFINYYENNKVPKRVSFQQIITNKQIKYRKIDNTNKSEFIIENYLEQLFTEKIKSFDIEFDGFKNPICSTYNLDMWETFASILNKLSITEQPINLPINQSINPPKNSQACNLLDPKLLNNARVLKKN
jgi:hypothetical protein